MNPSKLTRLELAAYICQALENNGIHVVLTGGSCVSIYSSEKYVSYDLDFVDISYASSRQIKSTLAGLGFTSPKPGRRYFESDQCPYAIEFPSAPLAVGDEPVAETRTEKLHTSSGILRLLSPTDCVKDRLSHYCFWHDRQGLEQAVLVASQQPVRLEEIKQWTVNEGYPEAYDEFFKLLTGNS